MAAKAEVVRKSVESDLMGVRIPLLPPNSAKQWSNISMRYHLFLDDERYPPSNCHQYTMWAKNLDQAWWYVNRLGCPSFLYLDHDLGGTETSMEFLKELQTKFPMTPPNYLIHSQNPIGSENMRSFMESWIKTATLE
jgi:hypothetical protein